MNRRWTIRTRILILLFAPLLPLLAMLIFATSTALGPAVNLRDANTATVKGAVPAATVLSDLQAERELSVILVSAPSPVPRTVSELTTARAQTDASYGALQKAVADRAFTAAANSQTLSHLEALQVQLSRVQTMRDTIDRGTSRANVMTFYDNAIEAMFGLYGSIASLDDHTLAREANTVVALSEAGELLAREDAALAGPLTSGKMTASDYTLLVGTIYTKRYLYGQATRYLTGAAAHSYDAIVKSDAYVRVQSMENTLIAHPNIGHKPDVNATEWHSNFTTLATALGLFESDQANGAIADTDNAAVGREWRLGIIAGASVLMLLILVYFSLTVARAILRRITALRQDALSLALDRLPSVIERLRVGQPVDLDAETPPLAHGTDELGQLGEAFTRVQATAIAAAVHEANLRQGFNQVFLNIARRSQTLLHRQLALLDGMERRTNEPDDLEELFRIDHLATRMRRHAEDLVILAGSTPGRGWRNPVPVADVLRAAASEVEEYARIVVAGLPDIALTGRAVSDVVHLLAELLENATLFSPPDTQVTLSAQMVPNGFAIEIEDRGLGMPADAIRDANERLATPPDFDPAHSSRLGLFVVSRLAARHHIEVMLRRSPYGGVTAVALIPGELVVSPTDITTTASAEITMEHRIPSPRPAIGSREEPMMGRPLAAVAAASLPPVPPVTAMPTRSRTSTVTLTADGLPQRVRQASLTRHLQEHGGAAGGGFGTPGDTDPVPAAAGNGAPAGFPGFPGGSGSSGGPGGPGGFGGSGTPGLPGSAPVPAAPAPRTPEQMRSMLSSFQDGMTLGRRDAASLSGSTVPKDAHPGPDATTPESAHRAPTPAPEPAASRTDTGAAPAVPGTIPVARGEGGHSEVAHGEVAHSEVAHSEGARSEGAHSEERQPE